MTIYPHLAQVSDLIQQVAESPSTAVIAIALFLALAAMRFSEKIVERFAPEAWRSKKGPTEAAEVPSCAMTSEERHKIRDLHRLHSPVDASGMPVWYSQCDPKVTAEIAQSLEKVSETQRDLAETQRDTLRIVERIDRRMDTPA